MLLCTFTVYVLCTYCARTVYVLECELIGVYCCCLFFCLLQSLSYFFLFLSLTLSLFLSLIMSHSLSHSRSHTHTHTHTSSFHDRYNSKFDCLSHVINKDGPRALYRGAWPSILRALPSYAVSFWGYETTLAFMEKKRTKSPLICGEKKE